MAIERDYKIPFRFTQELIAGPTELMEGCTCSACEAARRGATEALGKPGLNVTVDLPKDPGLEFDDPDEEPWADEDAPDPIIVTAPRMTMARAHGSQWTFPKGDK